MAADTSSGSNDCEGNNCVFAHILFLQFFFSDNVSNSKWIAQNPCFVR
jgi:hypothetical protein